MKCFLDCKREATDTHEIFPGNNRNLSIELGLQIRVCHDCHMNKLTRVPGHKEYQKKIVEKLGFDYTKLNRVMRKCNKFRTPEEQKYLLKVKNKMTENLKELI